MADKELTIKQQRFVDVYDGDIKKAAEKAGLSYRYCRRLATQRNIKSAIRAREGAKRNKLVLDRTQRQEFWSECIGFDVRKLCNDEGGAKNPNTLDDVSAKTVQSIKFTETVMMVGDDERRVKKGGAIWIPMGEKHSLVNDTNENTGFLVVANYPHRT